MNQLTDEIRSAIKKQLTAVPKYRDRPNISRRTSAGLWSRPHISQALGCNPDQIEENRKHLRSHGLNIDFTPTGEPIITSEKQYREVAKAYNIWSGSQGYGQQNSNGQRVLTGREREKAKEEWKRKVRSGEIDIFGE